MSKHTPGPWTSKNQVVRTVDSPANEIQVADCRATWDFRVTPEQAEANARLIAAAPELLSEVKNAKQVIQAVIDHMETGEPWSDSMIDDLKSELLGINLKIAKAEAVP